MIDGICTSMYLNEAVCVPKLITSKYVVYNFDTRYKLFDRIGAKDIKEYPVSIDMDYIKGEKAKLESLLKKVICPI
jgi:hypothetical protein